MAKRSSARAPSNVRTIIVRPVQAARRAVSRVRPIIVAAPKKMKTLHRRHHGGRELTEKHRMGAIAGGAVLGLLDKSGFALPTLPFLGKAGTAGVACWAIAKATKSAWADDMATGMLSIAAYELAKTGSIQGIDGDTDGYVAGV